MAFPQLSGLVQQQNEKISLDFEKLVIKFFCFS